MKSPISCLILLVTTLLLTLSCRKEMPETHTVVFVDIEGNSMGLVQMVEEDDTAFDPGIPGEIEGADFQGWRTNDGLLYDFGQAVEQDLVIICLYTLQSRTFIFDYNHEDKKDSIEVFYGETVDRPINDPERDYYTFEEWLQDGQTYDFSTNIIDKTTISATWSKDFGCTSTDEGIYLVTYYKDTPEVLTVPDSMYGQAVLGLKHERNSSTPIFGQSLMQPNTTTRIIDLTQATFLEEIHLMAFPYCTNLDSILFNNTLSYIGLQAFRKSSLASPLNLPESIKTIGNGAFLGFYTPQLTINKGLETIDYFAFSQSSGYSYLDLDCKVQFLSGSAFAACDDLKEVRLGQSIQTIDGKAFAGCNSLHTLTITRTELPLTNLVTNDITNSPFYDTPIYSGDLGSVIYYPEGTNYPNEPYWQDLKAEWIAVPVTD